MWADNETEVDLLGFDYLVDTLVVALTEPRLLPLTVGLLGDWGSGKSSLMRITRQELTGDGDGDEDGSRSRYVCVDFSPWQYEDYHDVKVALMSTVLEAVAARVQPEQQEKVSRLRRALQSLARWGRRGGRVALATAGTAAPLAWAAHDPTATPAALAMAKAGATTVAVEGAKLLEDRKAPAPDAAADSGTSEPVTDAGQFRAEFAEVVAGLRDVDAVVVFIDDLDRCLPESVIDTFEAIRLFLNTPKTAYVVAANQAVVESAIDSRYPELRRPDGAGIGADYLEKMLQLKVAIPTLSAPEADTYMNLLLAELHLDQAQFAAVLDETRRRRDAGNLQVSFNLGVATKVLTAPPPELVHDLQWAASISEVLGSGLRGNPRQLKRFLNNLMLKHRSAERRGISLELPTLAKLMVLEEQYFSDFQRLFEWQLGHTGPITELADAERLADTAASGAAASADPDLRVVPNGRGTRSSGNPRVNGASGRSDAQPDEESDRSDQRPPEPATVADDVRTWAEKAHVAAWLRLSPPLAGVDLRPYFTYSRDKLTFGVSAARLAPHLQDLLARLQSTDAAAARRAVCDQIGGLPEGERTELVDAFVDALARRPSSTSVAGALELAGRVPDTLQVICGTLLKVPVDAIPPGQAAAAVQLLPADDPTVSTLLDRWENSGVKGFKGLLGQAREARRRGRR